MKLTVEEVGMKFGGVAVELALLLQYRCLQVPQWSLQVVQWKQLRPVLPYPAVKHTQQAWMKKGAV